MGLYRRREVCIHGIQLLDYGFASHYGVLVLTNGVDHAMARLLSVYLHTLLVFCLCMAQRVGRKGRYQGEPLLSFTIDCLILSRIPWILIRV